MNNCCIRLKSRRRASLFASMLLAGVATPALAQQSDLPEDTETAELQTTTTPIVVTGSRISRPITDTPDPISVLGQGELQSRGVVTSVDLLKSIPQASRNKAITDGISDPIVMGTGQINLRGFGQAATLTLINGRRQVLAPVPNEDGSSYVDINTIPVNMIDRLEIVQNGAAAIYGSDAVAGVANFVLRRKFEGLQLTGDVRLVPDGNQRDFTLGLVTGFSSGNFDLVLGAEYFNRTNLRFVDRPFSENSIISGTGSPGAFAVPGSPPMPDPQCAAAGGIPISFGGGFGLCGINVSSYFDLIGPEERLSSYATANLNFGDIDLYVEGGFSFDQILQGTSPSSTVVSFPLVPANNPGNLVANGGFGVPVNFIGRPLGTRYPVNVNQHELDSNRIVVGLKGALTDNWNFDVSYTNAHQNKQLLLPGADVSRERFEAALNCQGGPNNDLCFNPFASALLDPALANDPAVIADFQRLSWRRYNSSLQAVEAVVTGQLGTLPGGPLGVAVGAQFRRDTLSYRSDDLSQNFGLGFYFTGGDFDVGRNTYAAFAEIDAPFFEGLDTQIAGRYEHVEDIGGTFTPKLGVKYEVMPGLIVRGSVSTSFRAPSLTQLTAIATVAQNINDPLNPSAIPFFTRVVAVPATDLEPEKSTNFGAGVLIEPASNLSFSADYYYYDYRDVVAKQDAQAIVSANPNDPQITRNGDPLTGLISSIDVSFQNQLSVVAQGIDFTASYRLPTDSAGTFSLTARGAYLISYKTDVGAGKENLVGLRNYQNFVDPLPQWRGNVNASWQLGPHELSVTAYYIDSYKENLASPTDPINGFKIDSVTTVDLQYSIAIEKLNSQLAIGVTNVFDVLPPAVGISNRDLSGFDPLVHDPRGRSIYATARVNF